jgi:predicted ATP-dependent serine protease
MLRENSGLCPACFRSGLIFTRYKRLADEYVPRVPGVTAQTLAKSVSRLSSLSCCPGVILGPGAFVVSHGGPGHGKSTQILKVADELKPSIVLPLEMSAGPLLASMLQRLEIHSPHVVFEEPRSLPEIFALAETRGLRALFVDSLSVSTLQPADARSMARANNIVVWGTLQETKGGTFRGSNAWAHEADVILEIKDMRWTVTKSRYQAAGLSGEVCASATDTRACSV